MQTARRYNKKRDVEELIAQRQVPDGKFDDLLEIRAIELRHLLTNKVLVPEEKQALLAESKFIEKLLNDKNIIIADNPKSSAFVLQDLYKKRDQCLTKLIEQMALIDSKATPIPIKDIQSLQEQILLIDKQISKITPSIEQLNIENMVADEKLALAFSSFFLAAAGSMLSVTGLLLVLGSVAFPPVIAPILIGFGIGMAAVSLAKFATEKFAEHQDANDKQKSSTNHKEFILEEALYGYEYELNPDNPGVGISSHAKYMQELLPQNEPVVTMPFDASLKEPPTTYQNPVFKKHVPSTEITNSPEKTPIDDVTPP